MRLRARVTLAALFATGPALLSLAAYDRISKHAAAAENLAAFTRRHLATGDACVDAPSWRVAHQPHEHGRGPPPSWGAPPPPAPPGERARPARAWAYDAQGRPAQPGTPPLPPGLRDDAMTHGLVVEPHRWGSDAVRLVMRTPWGAGTCALVLAEGSTSASWGAVLPRGWLWSLPMLAVFASVLLALEGVIRRVGALAAAARHAARAGYAVGVPAQGDDEVAALARALNEAGAEVREQLEERARRERALRDFVANTTHDVMIPLTVLQGHLAALREALDAGPVRDPQRVVAAMDEAHYLASLMHNLGAAARLDAVEGPLQRSPVDLIALVQRVVARHRPAAQQRRITLEHAVPDHLAPFAGDVTLLEQAVSNVTYNAVRYNRDGGHVAVVLEPEGDGFVLRVLDDGPGIPVAARAALLQRGARANEARSRAPDGQGLGLHIAARVMALHGVEMTLGTSEAGGLEVRFRGA
ncbi:MAG: HAMP domain-containing sensor histidine kinase [Polyangiales bacterium]